MITDKPISLDDCRIEDAAHASGALVTFEGVVRSQNDGRPVSGIHYDCYRDMAAAEMKRIVDEVVAASDVHAARAVHRVGELPAGEVCLIVVVAAAHRQAAFDASQQIISEIKQRVPIWKKERYANATAEWR